MRNRQQQTSFFSYTSSLGETRDASSCMIIIREHSPLINYSNINPSFQTIDHETNRRDVIKKIIAFIFSVVPVILYQIYVGEADDHRRILPESVQKFIFFLIVAFCSSLASISSCREPTQRLFQCITMVAMALAVASLASQFLHVWLQIGVYGICMMPLYASTQTLFHHWFQKSMKFGHETDEEEGYVCKCRRSTSWKRYGSCW